jgi:hypothetical protein
MWLPSVSEIVMPFVGELVLNYAAYRRIALSPGGPGAWLLRSVGVVILLCMGVLTLNDGGTRTTVLPVILGLMLVFGHELLVMLGWQQTSKLATRPWRYEITSSTVGIHTPQTSATVSWDGISRVRIRRHAWVFTVRSTGRSLVVPRAAFSGEAQQEIDRIVRERG